MNPSTSDGEGSHDSSGGVARSHKQREDYDDALVLATAMASGGAAAEAALQARSPPGDTGGTHHQYDGKRGDDDADDEDYEDNDRDSASSSTDQQYQRYAYLDQPQFPSSPMVTPPIRSYEAAAAAAVAAASAASLSTAKTQHATTSSGMMQPQGVAGIPHIYHDYSQVPEDSSYIRKKTGGVTQPFPEKLQEMLRAVDGTEATGIVSWLPHGRAFLVRKPKEFTEVIMPK